MKKVLAIILCMLLLLGTLCSCGASAKYDTAASEAASEAYYNDYYYEAAEEPAAAPSADGAYYEEDSLSSVVSALTRTEDLSAKMIYRAEAQIETVDFDKSVEDVYKLIESFGGFLENSDISGSSYSEKYYGYQTYRYARFTIRVPKENYAGMTDSLSSIGNVTNIYSSAENITQQYTDAQARLDTYEAEEERLVSMMAEAYTVEDLISIESRLSEVRYNIESITTTLRNWQNEIDYSTVVINLNEVAEIVPTVPVNRTFGEELRDGLAATFRSIGRFFKNLTKWFIINFPTLVIIAIIVIVIVFIIRRSVNNREARRIKRAAKRAAKKEKKSSEADDIGKEE